MNDQKLSKDDDSDKKFDLFLKKIEDVYETLAGTVAYPFNLLEEKVREGIEKIKQDRLKKKEQSADGIFLKKQLKELKQKLGAKVDHVEKIAVDIKQDTSQLLLNDEQFLSLLEGINYKSDCLEATLAPLMPKLEETLGKVDNLEDFMKDKLGSKWSKLKYQYQELKAGNITRKKFILTGFTVLGKTFLQVFAKVQA